MKRTFVPPSFAAAVALGALLPLLASCHAMRLSRAAKEAGVTGSLKDVSPVVGTFENTARDKFGPKQIRLWEQIRNREWIYDTPREGKDYSDFGDRVRLANSGKGMLEATLLSPEGKVRQLARIPCSVRGNYIHLHHSSHFGWLPLGYRFSNTDIAITASPGGDLVVLHRYEVGGIVYLIGTAGSTGTVEFRFRRL